MDKSNCRTVVSEETRHNGVKLQQNKAVDDHTTYLFIVWLQGGGRVSEDPNDYCKDRESHAARDFMGDKPTIVVPEENNQLLLFLFVQCLYHHCVFFVFTTAMGRFRFTVCDDIAVCNITICTPI